MKPLVSIVIPARNEEESIGKLLSILDEEINKIEDKIEVLVVDDASDDNTNQVIKDFAAGKPNFRILERKTVGGQTGAYRTAFREVRGEYIIRMDGDMQDDPRDLKSFICQIKQGNEIVVGLRSIRSHAPLNVIGSRVFDLVALLCYKSPFFENTSSFVAFKADLIKDIPLKKSFFFRNEHRYLVLIALSRKPKKYTEIVVHHYKRLKGKSKYRKFWKYYWAFFEFFILFWRIKSGFYEKIRQR